MGFFDITYDQVAVDLLPPDKRQSRNVAWLRSLLSQVQYARDVILGDYKEGNDTYPIWVAASYSKGDRVRYGESIYESLEDANTTEPVISTTWRQYLKFFIGVDERITYNHIKLTFEYALNKRFNTTFRQPPLVSDIFIETIDVGSSVLIVGATESESSAVYTTDSDGVVIDGYSFSDVYNFSINVPIAVYSALSSDPAAREKTIRNFADRYNTAGLTYQILTY